MVEFELTEAQQLQTIGVPPQKLADAISAIVSTLLGGGKVLTFGNGGSAADAQHLAAELVGRFELPRRALPAVALTTDTSALTAIANDFGFAQVFARQVEALGRPGDVAIGISTSGNSANVLQAVTRARELRLATVGLCGAPGCALCQLVDVPLAVAPGPTARVQELHLQLEHMMCRKVEQLLIEEEANEPPPPVGSVVSLPELLRLRERWRAARQTVVWTNGCFDVLHAGHLASLTAARELGAVLVVGMNGDVSVSRLKGPGRPLVPAAERAALLAALRPVHYVTVFEEDTPEAVLARLQPDVHCKGADYAGANGKPIPERELVESYGGRVEFLPLVRDRSTTALVQAIRRGSK